jgi:hypothetical protein
MAKIANFPKASVGLLAFTVKKKDPKIVTKEDKIFKKQQYMIKAVPGMINRNSFKRELVGFTLKLLTQCIKDSSAYICKTMRDTP